MCCYIIQGRASHVNPVAPDRGCRRPPLESRVMTKGIAGRPARMTLALLLLLPAADGAETDRAPADRLAVPGLQKPATVRIDQWGVPHVEAQTLYDAFVAQGFVAARDRLWQMDLWRRRGLGEMARDLGPAFAEGD